MRSESGQAASEVNKLATILSVGAISITEWAESEIGVQTLDDLPLEEAIPDRCDQIASQSKARPSSELPWPGLVAERIREERS